MEDPKDRPIQLPAVRRVLNALVDTKRALKKSRSYNNKDAFYILTDAELAAEGIVEDDNVLTRIINVKSASKKGGVIVEEYEEEDFEEDEDEDYD